MRRKILTLLTVLLLVGIPLVKPQRTVQADYITPRDLISLVNSIRTSYGLPALEENAILMDTAQWTADTMVAEGIHDHLVNHGYPGASTRIENAGYGDGSYVVGTENWAGGTSSWVTLSWIADVWSDAAHMIPMTDANYTDIGAGVTVDSSGYAIFIVHAAYSPGGSSGSPSTSPVITGPTATSNYVEPLFTVTPQSDGSIIHTVKYGQTLFTIATFYNVTIDQIKTLNGLTDNTIYEGQTLKIKMAPTATITPTRTATVPRPTRTPHLTSTPRLMNQVTPTPTSMPGILSEMPKIDRQWLGLGLLVISAVGFFVVVYFTFLKPMRKKE